MGRSLLREGKAFIIVSATHATTHLAANQRGIPKRYPFLSGYYLEIAFTHWCVGVRYETSVQLVLGDSTPAAAVTVEEVEAHAVANRRLRSALNGQGISACELVAGDVHIFKACAIFTRDLIDQGVCLSWIAWSCEVGKRIAAGLSPFFSKMALLTGRALLRRHQTTGQQCHRNPTN